LLEDEFIMRAIFSEQRKQGKENDWVWLKKIVEITSQLPDEIKMVTKLNYGSVRNHVISLVQSGLAETKPETTASSKKPVYVRLTEKGAKMINFLRFWPLSKSP